MSNVEKENQYIDHYFRENAFSNLSDEEEKTYIKLSTTDRFTLSQASEITNIHDLPRLTKIIEKQPFLLTTYVKGQQWFYYHNIFLHYLERLREHFFNNENIDILREKSAHWLYKNTHYKAAIDTILLCQRYDTAALWLCDYTVIAKRKGNHEQLMVWLKQLPPTTLNLYPVLVAAYALCFILQKQWVQSDSNTLALSQATPKNDADKLQIERTAPLLMMASLVLKDNIETLTNIDPWITQWQQHSGFRTTNDYNLEMGLAKLIKGFYAKCRSQFTEGNTALNEARKLFEAYSSDYGIAWTDTVHTLLLAKQGLEFEALSKAVEGLKFIQRHLQKDIDIHHMLTALVSTMYYQQADFDNAKKYFPKDIELLQSYGFTDILIAAYKTQARFLIDDEKIQHAIDQLKKNIKHAKSHSQHRVAFSLISELIVIMIHHDRGVEAKQYANAYDIGMDQTPKNLLLASLTYRARIYLLIDNQHFQKAQDIIEERIAIHIKQKRYAILAEYYRMLAVLHNKSDQPKDAELALQESLEISSSRHYLSLFNIDKKHLSDILNRLDSKKLSQNVRKFILKLQKTLLTPNTNQTQYVEKLTKKEILVIQLAESGDPTKHLAERLNISQGTLKWHLHNIYEKLHVKNRTQAIKSARDLGYL